MDHPQLLRVPLRVRSGKQKPNREKIFETFYLKLEVGLTSLKDTYQGYVAICQNEKDVDEVLTEKGTKALADINLEAKIPAQIATQRSIICRKLDQCVGGRTSADIKDEVERNQTWAKVREVIKFGKYTHVMKITFETTEMAQRALDGLHLFNMVITTSQIERETFTNIQMCFTCYKMEEHQTKDCPQKNTLLCSECSETGHRYNTCTKGKKLCLNCEGEHRTMSMSCPMKKQLIKDKKEQKVKDKEIKETETYAKIVKETRTQELEERPVLKISKDTPIEVLICILHAHVVNIGQPGSYATELNQMLEKNNLQKMWFPENPPSGRILNMELLEDTRQELATAEGSSTRVPTTTLTFEKSHETYKQPEAPKEKRLKKRERTEQTYKRKWAKRTEKFGELETDSDQEPILTETESVASDLNVQTLVAEMEERRLSKEKQTTEKPKTTATIKPNYEAGELEMKIFFTPKYPLPKSNNIQDILNGIKTGKYKYDYEHELSDSVIETLLFQGKIKVKMENCHQVPADIFQRKRNGKCRSPPEKSVRPKEPDRRQSK